MGFKNDSEALGRAVSLIPIISADKQFLDVAEN
jgi:hypothetical protein